MHDVVGKLAATDSGSPYVGSAISRQLQSEAKDLADDLTRAIDTERAAAREVFGFASGRHGGAVNEPWIDMPSPAAGRRCRLSPCAGSRPLREPCRRAMSSWYFSSTPSVSLIVLGSRSSASSSDSAVAQSIDSATPGALNRSSLRSSCTKPTTWRDRRSLAPGALTFEDLELALEVGIIDPMVEAAALQRVVDLARAVRGDDHDRRSAPP